MPKQEVLFIPGLGGRRSLGIQRSYGHILNMFGRHIHFFEPLWEDSDSDAPESNDVKYQRLEDFFELRNRPRVLYANSAGATLATRLAIQHSDEIDACHLVCGKVLGAAKIQEHYKQRAPAFEDAVEESEQAVKYIDAQTAQKFFCYVPRDREDDGVIEVVDMLIPGANIVELPPLNHASAIFHAMRKYLPSI